MGNKGCKKKKTRPELKQDELRELESKTNFSEGDIHLWHAGFYHDCPSGKLDRAEFIKIFNKFYVKDEKRAKLFAEYVFKTFTKESNKEMNFEDFLMAIASTRQGKLEDRLGIIFDMYHVSASGEIDLTELTNLITAMYNLVGEIDRDPKKTASEIFSELGLNNDKKLTKDVFIKACREDPKLMNMFAPNYDPKNEEPAKPDPPPPRKKQA